MKRTFILLLVAMLLTAIAPVSYAEEVEIEFWYSFEEFMREPILAEIARFEEANPGIKVIASYTGKFDESTQKLLAAHAAGAVPAVQQTYLDSVSAFAENGVIYPLDEFIAASNDDMSNYASGMYNAFSYDGKQYGVPAFSSVSPTFFYNKTMADEEGIEIPTSWDEMDAFLRKATQYDEQGNVTRVGLALAGWSDQYFQSLFYANGVDAFTDETKTMTGLGSEKAANLIKQIKGWIDEGLVTWYYGSGASQSMRQSFIDGNSFACFHSCALFEMYKTSFAEKGWEVGVAFQPAGEKTMATLSGSGLTIMAKASPEQREAAYKLIRWLTQPSTNMIIVRGTGYLPVTTDCLNSEDCQSWIEENPCLTELYDHLDDIYAPPVHKAWDDLATKWTDTLALILLENADVDSSLETMVEEMNEIIADNM